MDTRRLPPVEPESQARPRPVGVTPRSVIATRPVGAPPRPVAAPRPPAPPDALGRSTHGPAITPVAPDASTFPLWMLAVAGGAGALIALLTIPAWVPILAASLVGADPKVFWYLSRASGLVAFVLLWVSMASGLIISNKVARIWPGAFTAFDLHQYTSLLGLGFVVFHVVTLLGNGYIPYSIVQLLVPFASGDYRPLWVGVGQVALYVMILVTFTFYIRRQLGNRTWRLIHYLSYLMFGMALLHGVTSGTDSGNAWVSLLYWLGGVSMLALTIHRMMMSGQNLDGTPAQPSRAGMRRQP